VAVIDGGGSRVTDSRGAGARHAGPAPAGPWQPGPTSAGPWHATARPPRRLAEIASRVGARLLVGVVDASAGPVVTGISQDSRTVVPGDLYVALAGASWHGARFTAQAAAAGAVAVLVEPSESGLVPAAGLPTVDVTDLRRRIGPLASWLYGEPSSAMDVFGVTGTNGKTSTAYLLEAGLAAAGHRTGLVSGVAVRGPGGSRPAVRTTPEATDLQRLLAVFAGQGVSAAAVEVSSHGLELNRVDGTVFRAAVFTNLGRDHLDMHTDMAGYYAAKARLFGSDRCGLAVIGLDDRWGRRLAAEAQVPVVTFAGAGAPEPADWTARDVQATAAGTSFRLTGPGVDVPVRLGLLGAHQADNATGATAALVSTGTDVQAAVRGVESLSGVPGRLERVNIGQSFTAFVDYVHNESGQARVYPFLRSLGSGRLIVVMGATGDRDPGKREPLGRNAGSVADVVVVTDESPHSEDPAALRNATVAGARAGGRAQVLVEPDRAAAFDLGVSLARPGDVVVVSGRGHDPTQFGNGTSRTFDDRVQPRAALQRHAH